LAPDIRLELGELVGEDNAMNILITGDAGYVGSQLGKQLTQNHHVVGVDLHPRQDLGFMVQALDIRDPALADLIQQESISHVVHLAAVLEDSGDRARDFDIDVNGTRNVLACCVQSGVQHLTVTSSGAAYGYHPDQPAWLSETDPLRGNAEFAYSDHKRQVEELLADYRKQHPDLAQLVLRVGTVLGAHTDNLITALFAQRRLIGVRGSASPFVFIWDQDLLQIIHQGVSSSQAGIFNVAGDGALPLRELAKMLRKPYIALPASILRTALRLGKALGLSRYGPEQIRFLQYRPVLSNTALKQSFGYQPQKSSAEVFAYYIHHARQRGAL
jgi:UDP-glucose 4-epimerase